MSCRLTESFLGFHFWLWALENVRFDQYNNIPQGFAPYVKGKKVFISVPRRYAGVPSTLNYVKLDDKKKLYENPKLHPYPNFKMNELDVSLKF